MTLAQFLDRCAELVGDVAPKCKVVAVHKNWSVNTMEAEFTIKVQLADAVEPNVVVDGPVRG